jgi:hypothetical protein
MTRIEFDVKINWFLEFYGVVMTQLQCGVWFKIFGKLKPDELQKAFDWHIEHDQYSTLPAPGKITYALEQLADEYTNSRRSEYPIPSALWCSVITEFPERQNYPHFPPEPSDPPTDEELAPWKRLYDQICRKPESMRKQAVIEAMEELEVKYK